MSLGDGIEPIERCRRQRSARAKGLRRRLKWFLEAVSGDKGRKVTSLLDED